MRLASCSLCRNRGASEFAQRSASVEERAGFSVYDAIVDQIDCTSPDPWLTLLKKLNASQRVVVSIVQVHEHAASIAENLTSGCPIL